MSVRSKHPVSVRRSLCLAALILGLLGLSFGLAPGTVLAYNPSDVYTEEPPPTTPSKDKDPEKKNPGKKKNPGNQDKPGKKNNAGNQDDGGGNDSGTVGTVVPVDGSGNPPAGTDGTGNSSDGAPVDTTQAGEPDAQENIAAGTDDGTVAVTPASESKSDDGGSALPLIIAILVGVPLIGFGAYYFWARHRSRDDDFHDLNSAYGGEQH